MQTESYKQQTKSSKNSGQANSAYGYKYSEEPNLYKDLVEKGYIYCVGFAVVGCLVFGAPAGAIGGAGLGLAFGVNKALKSAK